MGRNWPKFRTITEVIDSGVSFDHPQSVEPYLICDTPDHKRRLDALKQRVFDYRKTDPIFFFTCSVKPDKRDSKVFKHRNLVERSGGLSDNAVGPPPGGRSELLHKHTRGAIQ